MARSPAVATPGEAQPAADLEAAVLQEGLRAEVAETDVERLTRELAETRDLVRQLAANQKLQAAAPVQVKLPTMAEVVKLKPTVPMLTEEGWFVPQAVAAPVAVRMA